LRSVSVVENIAKHHKNGLLDLIVVKQHHVQQKLRYSVIHNPLYVLNIANNHVLDNVDDNYFEARFVNLKHAMKLVQKAKVY